jgi:hypothetical protein
LALGVGCGVGVDGDFVKALATMEMDLDRFLLCWIYNRLLLCCFSPNLLGFCFFIYFLRVPTPDPNSAVTFGRLLADKFSVLCSETPGKLCGPWHTMLEIMEMLKTLEQKHV